MRYKRISGSKFKRGFTILETMVYSFITTMILAEGINLLVLMYGNYIESTKESIKYNDFQNLNINLDNIISEERIENIAVDDKNISFIKNDGTTKLIKSYNGEIFVKYLQNGNTKTINCMIGNINRLEVKKKGNLIYLIVFDNEGQEFIRCI